MKGTFLLFALVAAGMMAWGNTELSAEVIATITGDVQTEFGTYHPNPVQITPKARSYQVAEDFSNVGNFAEFDFSEADRLLLAQNLFVVKPSPSVEEYGESGLQTRGQVLHEIYQDCKDREIPIFVTTDAMLHTFHILYDYALRALEVERFADDLDLLNKALVAETQQQIAASGQDSVRAILHKNLAFFSVAAVLKDEAFAIPPSVADLVEAELALIEAHEGFAPSPIFSVQVPEALDYVEDYSQYVPRGHYTRNETLATYFKSMMWYGRMAFRVEPGSVGALKEKGIEETYQAILIVQALCGLMVDGRPALDIWRSMYDPTVFFVGKSDDLHVGDYRTLIAQIYGENWQSLSPDALYDRNKLLAFIEEAKKLRDPLINSSWVLDTRDPKRATKSFRFMGQRFIPDSYMLWQLVYTNVGTQANPRLMPKGLDVMSVLGSERSLEHLIGRYHQDGYEKYSEQMAKLKAEFETLAPEVWAQNLYWNWLYALMPLLEEKGAGYPPFMQNAAWTDRQLTAALGSWTELRHDTILYAKQSYTVVVTAEPPIPPVPASKQGMVEPIPEVFGRLASLAGLMKEGLSSRGLLLDVFAGKLTAFENLQLHLGEIAQKELSNTPLSYQDFERIVTVGDALAEILTFPKENAQAWESDTDKNMALVADVHTDPNTGRVLEEAVGNPAEIYVIAQVAGRIKVTKGALFTYYEFAHPLSDRLTDEAWQEMLAEGNVPDAPEWTASFQDISARGAQAGYSGEEENKGLAVPQVTVDTFSPALGEDVKISFSSTVPLEEIPLLEITPPGRAAFTVQMQPVSAFQGFLYVLPTQGWKKGSAHVVARASYRSGSPTSVLSEMRYDLVLSIGGGTDAEGPDDKVPSVFGLAQNVPNPFNPSTTIRFTVPETNSGTPVNLTIYDLLGQKVRTLMEGQVEAGGMAVTWNGRNDHGREVSSGVYLYRLTTEGGKWTETRKMVLIR
ncbi:MAG: DUF3160 domain-containing protein [Candidatus Latescibacterota bacterium]